jgi:hypothetical protein
MAFQNGTKKSPRHVGSLAGSVVAGLIVLGLLVLGGSLEGQSDAPLASSGDSPVFTPAHTSMIEAARHFLGLRADPVQPIPFIHQIHIDEAFLTCDYCHSGAGRGPVAGFPSVNVCMDCHLGVAGVATDREPIQTLTAYWERGEEPPWQRVYGWSEEAHVRFNHAPHIRAEVDCTTCHGDVAQMTVAERVVDHTMRFCVECHEQRQASIDCLTCHY